MCTGLLLFTLKNRAGERRKHIITVWNSFRETTVTTTGGEQKRLGPRECFPNAAEDSVFPSIATDSHHRKVTPESSWSWPQALRRPHLGSSHVVWHTMYNKTNQTFSSRQDKKWRKKKVFSHQNSWCLDSETCARCVLQVWVSRSVATEGTLTDFSWKKAGWWSRCATF